MEHRNSREVAPFFHDAVEQIFRNPRKQLFVMPGGIRTGKTTNFLILGAYRIAQHVVATKQGTRMVRESVWAAVRESENSAVQTLIESIEDSIFTPGIMAEENSPVKIMGSHPRYIKIEHELTDGTYLKMIIECHGFNNEQAENRLRSRSFLGALVPEIQGIPWLIVKTLMERCGTWRPSTCMIEWDVDGVKKILSGAAELKMVLADMNIPKRPHPVYDNLFDNPNLEKSPYLVINPPPILIPRPVESINTPIPEEYPQSLYKKKQVVWLPNPEAYAMTRHFERRDANRNPIPWSGYEIWFAKIEASTESEIHRLVLGLPDSMGGAAAVYPNFDKDVHVTERAFQPNKTVYIGYDPGKYAAFIFMQEHDGETIHIFHELIFDHEDNLNNRSQIEDFLKPYLESELSGVPYEVIPDPAAFFATSAGEAPVAVLKENFINVRPCIVANQDTSSRHDCLEYFIDKERITVDKSCERIITALAGGYKYLTTRAGVVSANIDKNIFSHAAEAAQYPVVNLYRMLISKKGKERRGRSNKKIHRIKAVTR